MTNTATDKAAIDALAAGDFTFVDDTSAAGATKKFTPAQLSTFVGTDNLSNLASASTSRANLGVAIGVDVEAFDADILKADTADTLTAGFATTSFSAGTKSSGTYTPDQASGNFQFAVNGGAHTLAPPTLESTINIQYTNNASAGTITTSGFTKVTGDTITTTDGDDFFFFIVKNNSKSHLHVQALQ